ncbi:DUF4132 domain-containing protein [Streptomyces sp. S07_1.15]|uniref:DUF4132 domain-containing protein n=1 Tax=Streptomyces sp. S07_1.15 TaxID=2873925 RepID=UPI001D14B459|nr:DUF4132 domain-containing protein [Streptomyces sp. S07_1.15]MCC3655188.1 DUF4132 domain-containing protein [Streptomyces sp. S07_1.15]
MRRWEFEDGKAAKFWEAGSAGAVVTVRYGRIGSQGRTQEKDCGSAEGAEAYLAKVIGEKERKGYVSVDGPGAPGGPASGAAAGVSGAAGTAGAPARTGQAAPRAPESQESREAPDEDTFAMPAAWRRQVRPRRGGLRRSVAAPAKDAVELWHGRLRSGEQSIRKALGAEGRDERMAAAARAHLAGEADPLGAAVLAVITESWQRRYEPVVDAWVLLHGLPFAARAVVELFEVGVSITYSQRHIRTADSLGALPEGAHQYLSHMRRPAADRVRALLAVAGEDTHREAVAAVAAVRGEASGTRRRIVAAYLVPGETGWVDECCADPGPSGTEDHSIRSLLFESLYAPEQLHRLAAGPGVNPVNGTLATVATLAEGTGTAVAGLIDAYLANSYVSADAMKAMAGALVELPTDEAFGMLLARVEDKHVRTALLEAARRYPVRAARMLAEAAAGSGREFGTARQILAAHVAVHRELLEPRLDGFSEEVAETVAGLLDPAGRVADAPAEALPALLVSPPWTRKRVVRKPRTVTGLSACAPARVVWLPGEREEWAATESSSREWYRRFRLEKDVARLREGGGPLRHHTVNLFAEGPEDLVRPLLDDWQPDTLWDADEAMKPVAARFGTEALPGLRRTAARHPATLGAILLPYLDVEVARLMADWSMRLKSAAGTARSWFERHGAAPAALLVPDAVGAAGPARRRAEHALRLIAARHGAGAVREAAAGYGSEAAAAVEELLSADPLENALPARMPQADAWAEPALLPQVLLRDDRGALPSASVRHLLTMLAISKPGQVYPGVGIVRETCDPGSLARFAWALFEQWRLAGMPAKDSWALHALGLLGDDDTVRALSPVLRAWPGQGAHHRAVEGLDVLAAIGSDVALMHLHGIAQRVKFKALKVRAKEKIAEVAAGLGLSGEQLADRLVPDFGLDANGSAVVDYGPRRFTVGFDEQLRPYVLDEDGKRRKDLPKPGARDDAELAPLERKRFLALKKDVRTVASDQVRRFESAMVEGRVWSAAEFRELFVAHPLLGHLVRRLVWLCATGGGGAEAGGAGAGTAAGAPGAGTSATGSGGGGTGGADSGGGTRGKRSVTAFRVAEDRTFADAGDEEFTLPGDATVRLAHPLNLGAELPVWAELFADYEILQPFPQLGRPVHRLTEQEAAGGRLGRFEGITVDTRKLLGLERRGWQRGEPQDAGVECWISRRVAEKRWVILNPSDGIAVGAIDIFPEQKVEAVWLHNRPGDWSPPHQGIELAFADIDPVILSEVIADLTELTAA